MDSRMQATPLLTLDEIRQRMAALRAELNRLDRDQTVFARGFHTLVAQAVYAALLEDEARLVALPTLDLTFDDVLETTHPTEFDLLPWSAAGGGRRREILDV